MKKTIKNTLGNTLYRLCVFILLATVLSCNKKELNELRVPLAVNNTIVRVADTAGTTIVPVYSKGNWKAEIDKNVSWATLERAEGKGNSFLTVKFDSNKDGLNRAFIIIIKTESEEKHISFQQRGMASNIDISLTNLNVKSAAGTADIGFTINVPQEEIVYSVDYEGQPAWISDLVLENSQISFSYGKNEGDDKRRATIKMSYVDDFGATVKDSVFVNQNSIIVDDERILLGWYFNAADGYTFTQGNEDFIEARIVDSYISSSKLTRGDAFLKMPNTLIRMFMAKFKYASLDPVNKDNSRKSAFDNGAYFQFTFNPKESNLASLSKIYYKLRAGANSVFSYRWAYSLDNWNTYEELDDRDRTIDYPSGANGVVQPELDLSSIQELRNLPSNTPVVFRIYFWGATNATTSTMCIGRSDDVNTPSVVLGLYGITK